MCSEFGNWGLPDPDELKDADGREPWWFETGHDWGEGVMYAHGVENRFADWSLDRVFGTLQAFVRAAQWQQFRALKYQIEAMRRKPALAGYAITEFTDAHWESSGLLDMRRNRRVFHEVFASINADTVILPRADASSYWAGGRARLDLAIAHGAGERLEHATLEVALGEEVERLPLPAINAGDVVDLGTVELVLPDRAEAQIGQVRCRLVSAAGHIIASNSLELAIYPAPSPNQAKAINAWSPEPGIQEQLTALGYDMTPHLASADIAVTRHQDADIAAYVRSGGRLLLCPEAELSLHPFFPHWQNVRVLKRADTLWQGDWASTFSWLNRAGPFAGLPGGLLLDAAFEKVLPRHVIGGCNLLDFQARVHAGLVVGWIHKAAALIVERSYGTGRVVASTFRLFHDGTRGDPTAAVLLQALINLALGEASVPTTQAEPVDFEPFESKSSARSGAPI
jgi:hypothetical protein